ncbi:hypothetical protein HK100_001008 [Physocladia obscura]|uniref:BHLH domain-containing protein n=1 Tax=Physocladia obscura TaxID=109957 RepID=A0AAD5SXS0_9FUNG|nr:hypothetical protein HK100_001008 [Physocladia obscura]
MQGDVLPAQKQQDQTTGKKYERDNFDNSDRLCHAIKVGFVECIPQEQSSNRGEAVNQLAKIREQWEVDKQVERLTVEEVFYPKLVEALWKSNGVIVGGNGEKLFDVFEDSRIQEAELNQMDANEFADRKAHHNSTERARRETLNASFWRMAMLVPSLRAMMERTEREREREREREGEHGLERERERDGEAPEKDKAGASVLLPASKLSILHETCQHIQTLTTQLAAADQKCFALVAELHRICGLTGLQPDLQAFDVDAEEPVRMTRATKPQAYQAQLKQQPYPQQQQQQQQQLTHPYPHCLHQQMAQQSFVPSVQSPQQRKRNRSPSPSPLLGDSTSDNNATVSPLTPPQNICAIESTAASSPLSLRTAMAVTTIATAALAPTTTISSFPSAVLTPPQSLSLANESGAPLILPPPPASLICMGPVCFRQNMPTLSPPPVMLITVETTGAAQGQHHERVLGKGGRRKGSLNVKTLVSSSAKKRHLALLAEVGGSGSGSGGTRKANVTATMPVTTAAAGGTMMVGKTVSAIAPPVFVRLPLAKNMNN